jgi:Ni,Fe-hydrogenase III small subunit
MKKQWLDIPSAHFTMTILRRFFQSLVGWKADFTRADSQVSSRNQHRSLSIRVVDCGSSGAAEQEILAIFNPVYDAERFGVHLVTSPRHADVLLVSGPLARNMEAALIAAFEAMPEPRQVVTIGDDLNGPGLFDDSYAVVPLPSVVAAAVVAHVPGNPPAPADILAALLEIDAR